LHGNYNDDYMKNFESSILAYFKEKAREVTIRELVDQFDLNRNTIAKYLEALVRRGDIEVRNVGMSKLYQISSRISARGILRLIMDPACIIDSERTMISYNNAFSEFFSLQQNSKKSQTLQKIPEEFNQEDLCDAIIEGIQGKKTEEIQKMKVSGRTYVLHIKILPLILEDNTFGCVVICRDESHVQKLSIFLEESEGRYRAIVDDQLDLVCRRAPDLTLSYVNKAYCDAARRSIDDLLDNRLFPFVLTNLSNETKSVYRQITEDNPNIEFETKDVSSNGQVRWLQWKLRGFFSSQGEILEYHAIGRDITSLKRCEEQIRIFQQSLEYLVQERTHELQESNQKLVEQLMIQEKKEISLKERELLLKSIFNNITDPCLLFEQNDNGEPSRIIEANNSACHVLQYSHEELLSMVSTDITTENYWNEYLNSYANLLAENKHIRYSGVGKRKDGKIFHIEISAQRFKIRKKSVVLMIGKCPKE